MRTFALAIAAFFAIGAQATWCEYYYDAQCEQNANGGTSFDCANHGTFGSGGRYVQCHGTKTNQQDCIISRCTSNNCATIIDSKQVSASGSCVDMGGAGPWYEERFA